MVGARVEVAELLLAQLVLARVARLELVDDDAPAVKEGGGAEEEEEEGSAVFVAERRARESRERGSAHVGGEVAWQ